MRESARRFRPPCSGRSIVWKLIVTAGSRNGALVGAYRRGAGRLRVRRHGTPAVELTWALILPEDAVRPEGTRLSARPARGSRASGSTLTGKRLGIDPVSGRRQGGARGADLRN